MHPITIVSRLGKINGMSNEQIVYFDSYDQKSSKNIRHFILIEESIKLMYEPWGWKDQWYVDLIKIETISQNEIHIKDMYIDIIVQGNGPTYKIIDFDDFSDALVKGLININDIEFTLKKLQNFLDHHLHDCRDFPPTIIKQYL